jgi:transcriptional regulator of acetoin/glycerol metabolism
VLHQETAENVERVVNQMSTLEDVEATVITSSLKAHGGNVSATARALGVSRNTIYRKMQH